MTHDERIARLEEKFHAIADDISEIKENQEKILDYIMNGALDKRIKNVLHQQIGNWTVAAFLTGGVLALLLNFFLQMVVNQW